jgi:hypothetical protein
MTPFQQPILVVPSLIMNDQSLNREAQPLYRTFISCVRPYYTNLANG